MKAGIIRKWGHSSFSCHKRVVPLEESPPFPISSGLRRAELLELRSRAVGNDAALATAQSRVARFQRQRAIHVYPQARSHRLETQPVPRAKTHRQTGGGEHAHGPADHLAQRD